MPVLDEYFPFDVNYGNPANTARWRKMAQLWQADGVVAGYLNQLNATLAGTTVTVGSGWSLHSRLLRRSPEPDVRHWRRHQRHQVVAGIDLVGQDDLDLLPRHSGWTTGRRPDQQLRTRRHKVGDPSLLSEWHLPH